VHCRNDGRLAIVWLLWICREWDCMTAANQPVGPCLRLKQQRLDIRPLSECDEAFVLRVCTDADTMQYIGPTDVHGQGCAQFSVGCCLDAPRPAKGMFSPVAMRSLQLKIGICSIQHRSPFGTDRAGLAQVFRKRPGGAKGKYYRIRRAGGNCSRSMQIWLHFKEHSSCRRLFIAAGFSRCLDAQRTVRAPAKRVWRLSAIMSQVGSGQPMRGDIVGLMARGARILQFAMVNNVWGIMVSHVINFLKDSGRTRTCVMHRLTQWGKQGPDGGGH